MDKKTIKWLISNCHSVLPGITVLTLCNILLAGFSLMFSMLCRSVVDSGIAGNTQEFIRAAIALFAIIIAFIILRCINNAVEEYIRARLTIQLQQSTLHTLYNRDFSSVTTYHSGELLNRMMSDVQVITTGVTGIIPVCANQGIRIVGAIILLLWLGQGLVLAFIGAGLALMCLGYLFKRRYKAMHRQVQDAEDAVRSGMQEALENLLAVKSFGAETAMENDIHLRQEAFYSIQMKRRRLSIVINGGVDALFNMGYCVALVIGAFGLMLGWPGMTYGTLTAVLQLVGQVQSPFANLAGLLPRVYATLASAERLIELETLPQEPQMYNRLAITALDAIRINNLSFGYNTSQLVLTGIDIVVRAGDCVAICGVSGGGKTTFFLLLMGIYTPNVGNIVLSIDQKNQIAGMATRSAFAWVPQGHYLFSGSIRENVQMMSGTKTDEQIWEALDIACASEFVQNLPKGLDTPVGERGSRVSEGQMQRISLARAILSDAPVLLLDEATSALDEATEAKLLINIKQLKRTCIIVTHRKAALAVCNQRYNLIDGRLVKEDD